MASTAVMSVLGFIFWVFVAHLYTPSDIGVASALISVTTLISNFSLLGLTSGMVRFLSGQKNQSKDINAAAVTVAFISTLSALAYVVVFTRIGGSIELLNSPWHKFVYVGLLAVVSLNSLTDAVFIANRRGEYHTIGYATFGVVKLLLPLVFVPFGALGIFGAYILAMLASLLVSVYLMKRGCGYHLRTEPDWTLMKSMRRYTTHNYLAVVVAGLPSQLMPLFIIRHLGPADAAFFSMAWTMANLLYIVPSAVTQSMLAESSYDNRRKAEHLKHTIRLLALILVPGVIGAVTVSPVLLSLFGPQYREHGTLLFQILALSTLFIAVSSVGTTMLNIERRAGGVLAVQCASALTISVTAFYFIRFGLQGIGFAFLSGTVVSSLLVCLLWLHRSRTRTRPATFPGDGVDLAPLLKPYGITEFSSSRLWNGSSNRTLLVSTADKRFVLRIYRPGLLKDEQIAQEIAFTEYLACSGVRTPHIVTTADGDKFMHCSDGQSTWQYLLMDYVQGEHPRHYTHEVLKHMADVQASLHLKGIEYARGSNTFRRRVPFALLIRQFVIGSVTPTGYSHFDFDSSNVLFDDGKVSCVLDFEGMRYGPLVGCLYFTLEQIYREHQSPAQVKDYLDAYVHTRQLSVWEKLIVRTALAVRCRNPGLLQLRIA